MMIIIIMIIIILKNNNIYYNNYNNKEDKIIRILRVLLTFANCIEPDEMQHTAAFHQGMHCLLRFKQPSATEIHHNLENSTCDP